MRGPYLLHLAGFFLNARLFRAIDLYEPKKGLEMAIRRFEAAKNSYWGVSESRPETEETRF
jgi:hypothetical protein